VFEVPRALVATQVRFYGEAGQTWVAGLHDLAARYLDRWRLELDGLPRHGYVALVLPVRRDDGTPAALKLQPIDEEHLGEAAALRAWNGDGAVRLLDDDPATGTMLLERLHGDRSLLDEPNELAAVRIIAELLARLTSCPAPPEIRPLAEVAAKMVIDAPAAANALVDTRERWLLLRWASIVGELAPYPGNRLLHWDLHFENVLAAEREPWLAIDPKPLAGDPGFELLPALHNRWDEIVATGTVDRAVRRRFDLMVEVLGLDRQRAVAWTLGRVLQNSLWDIENGVVKLNPIQRTIGEAFTA
jgi:streptomycin 6-kinase